MDFPMRVAAEVVCSSVSSSSVVMLLAWRRRCAWSSCWEARVSEANMSLSIPCSRESWRAASSAAWRRDSSWRSVSCCQAGLRKWLTIWFCNAIEDAAAEATTPTNAESSSLAFRVTSSTDSF
jgi:hypothetical protein